MILGYIGQSEQEGALYRVIIQKGLTYLRNTDFSKIAVGKHKVDGDAILAIVSEYSPDAKENRKAETHNNHIDIQYIACGEEIMGFGSLIYGVETAEGYLPEKDATFYQSVKNELDVKVTQGMYAVFFPWDIHRPGCISQPGVKVRKVVLKLKVSDL